MYFYDKYFKLGRECLIPDISRTYHFGENGLNVDEKMQGQFFIYEFSIFSQLIHPFYILGLN